MAKKQPTKTCSDCIHESACRVWTDGRVISDATASQCPNHETVKESGAYLCGVLDERKRKQTNAERIRAMSDEELAELFQSIIHERDVTMIEKLKGQGIEASLVEAPVLSAKAHLEWLTQPVEEATPNG